MHICCSGKRWPGTADTVGGYGDFCCDYHLQLWLQILGKCAVSALHLIASASSAVVRRCSKTWQMPATTDTIAASVAMGLLLWLSLAIAITNLRLMCCGCLALDIAAAKNGSG